jgi:hypothetical protein
MIDRVNGVPCLTEGDVHTSFEQNEKVTGTVSLAKENEASLVVLFVGEIHHRLHKLFAQSPQNV